MGLFSKAKAPTPPDLIGAAQQQGIENRNAATDVMNNNRYGQVGPEGSSNQWVTDPTTGAVSNVTTMGAQPKAYYDALMGNGVNNLNTFQAKYWGAGGAAPTAPSGGGGGMSINFSGGDAGPGIPGGIYATDKKTGVGGVGGGIQSDLDYSKLGAMPTADADTQQQVQDALYKQQSQYLDPQFQQAQQQLETKLSNQGLVPGTPAYNNAMQIENDARQKAYSDARTSAITGGGAEQQRLLEMQLALRNQGVTEAGNLGAFHNASQAQRAGQLLTDTGQQRTLQGSLANANANVTSAGIGAASAANRLALDQRAQEYNEATGMGKSANAFLPQFGIQQGNMPNYAAAPTYNATQNQYTDALAQFNANKGSGLSSMIPSIGSWLGNSTFGKAVPGMIANAVGL